MPIEFKYPSYLNLCISLRIFSNIIRHAGVRGRRYQMAPFSEYRACGANRSDLRRIIQSQSPFTEKHNDVLPVKMQKGLWEQLWARV